MKNLEKKLMEEIARHRAINNYTNRLMEQAELPPADTAMDPTASPPADTAGLPPSDPGVTPLPSDASVEPETEEIDITDLVNMTKSIKKDLDDKNTENMEVVNKMDSVFTKLNDLEQKLSQMDSVISKIDELGNKVETMKEKTPQEKLQLRSLDSYPFNLNPQQFFAQKQTEMQQSGKNEYVLTKQDIDDYSLDTIRNSFNPEQEEDEFKF